MKRQSVKSIIDIVLLSESKKAPISGYEIMAYINEVYGVTISAGTIYARLYSLERDGLISSIVGEESKTFEITDSGNEILQGLTEKILETLDTFKKTSRAN